MTTVFTLYRESDDRPMVEINGTIQSVKRFLNPSNPNAATVNGTKASDGRGNSFRVSRKVTK
jgi:hypothetical protein